ncbi:MAG: hypothetical protein EMLJLAPB_01176 [Candidatus Argoarchaeum ethanivorans]|uniref:Uncharacterized protein n=1 Tax=Candidatus Argoarchaeum ethanivorans TaxID=2608793 RepID=A0A811TJR5_9EURY|nr:MAG: hypothetical protein EMLJLAPB_01176 [Candidatus Argoarchaeum ethanivorans]
MMQSELLCNPTRGVVRTYIDVHKVRNGKRR